MTTVLSVDLGSTYTKGALFAVSPDRPALIRRASVPTTTSDLAEGFDGLLRKLLGRRRAGGLPPLYLSSSARGGLSIAAVGIVPELTLQAARLAAASAGGRVVASLAYRLTDDDIVRLEQLNPDIILFSGGSDGGNERYNLENARKLAGSRLTSTILYAGNRTIRDEVQAALAGKPTEICDNLMPEVGRLAVEPARERIRQIFLDRIVEGKGLSSVAAQAAAAPKPTPRAIFDLLGVLDSHGRWNDTILIDVGGATTDCYSLGDSFHGESGTVLRGFLKPRLKRTIEGDLGMRVSAPAVLETAGDYLDTRLAAMRVPRADFDAYVATVAAAPAVPGVFPRRRLFDRLLAAACVREALVRHAGRLEQHYTPEGKILLQRGKDLRTIIRWIGGGGYLARLRSAGWNRRVIESARRGSPDSLLPRPAACYVDAGHLLPLIANLADAYPREAVQLADECLRCLDIPKVATECPPR